MFRPELPAPLPMHSGTRLVLGLAVAAILLSMGRMVTLANADTLIPVLASLYRWTWFYWRQNRLGLPIALLATVIHNPLHNFIAQTVLSSFFALGTFALVGVFVAGLRNGTVVGLVAAAIFVAAAPPGFHHQFLMLDGSYGIGLTTAMLGLLLLENWTTVRAQWRWLGAGLLLFLAFWANIAVVSFVFPLACVRSVWGSDVTRGEQTPRWWRRWEWVTVLVPSFAVNYWVTLTYRYRDDLSLVPLSDVPKGFLAITRNTLATFDASFAWVVAVLAVAVVTTAILRRAEIRPLLRGSMAVLTGILGSLTVVVTSAHVWENGLAFRYAMPTVVTLLSTLVAVALTPWLTLEGKRFIALEWALVTSLLLATIVRYGMPSPTVVRTIVEDKFGKRTPELLASGCPMLLGDYWEVWPTVFHSNLTLYESGQKRVVWGVAHRAEVTIDVWGPLVGKACIAVPATRASKAQAIATANQLKMPPMVESPLQQPGDQVVILRPKR